MLNYIENNNNLEILNLQNLQSVSFYIKRV